MLRERRAHWDHVACVDAVDLHLDVAGSGCRLGCDGVDTYVLLERTRDCVATIVDCAVLLEEEGAGREGVGKLRDRQATRCIKTSHPVCGPDVCLRDQRGEVDIGELQAATRRVDAQELEGVGGGEGWDTRVGGGEQPACAVVELEDVGRCRRVHPHVTRIGVLGLRS